MLKIQTILVLKIQENRVKNSKNIVLKNFSVKTFLKSVLKN